MHVQYDINHIEYTLCVQYDIKRIKKLVHESYGPVKQPKKSVPYEDTAAPGHGATIL